jgi:SAM-dependent methyltransferase
MAGHEAEDRRPAVQAQTIEDFGAQWTRYSANEDYYASSAMFADICSPLLAPDQVAGRAVADLGSGTGRIVDMLLDAGAAHVTAVEPSSAFDVLKRNTTRRAGQISYVNARADELPDGPYDLVVSIGVLHHIADPKPVVARAFATLAGGGRMLIWLYGKEGNGLYLSIVQPIRQITQRLPDRVLAGVCHVLTAMLTVYAWAATILPLPMRHYMREVIGRYGWSHKFLTIFDQLNPAYAKYYTASEARALLADAGFDDVQLHHRHGYSWTVIGTKPAP